MAARGVCAITNTDTAASTLATSGHSLHDDGDLHLFLHRGLHSHSAVLRAHAFLLRRGLLLSSSSSVASPHAQHYLLCLLLRHLPPLLPLFSLDATLRAFATRIPFFALLSLFAYLLRSYHEPSGCPDGFSFPFLLSAASTSASSRLHLPSALSLHAQLLHHSLLFTPPPHAANALLHFYATTSRLPSACQMFDEMPFRDIPSHNTMMMAYAAAVGCIDDACHLFDGMLLRNVVSWNIMINGYVVKWPEKALEVVRWMVGVGVRGSTTMIVGAATVCARLGRLGSGREVHCAFLRHFEEDNLLFWTSLVDMYGKCRRVEAARKVLDRLRMQNLVC